MALEGAGWRWMAQEGIGGRCAVLCDRRRKSRRPLVKLLQVPRGRNATTTIAVIATTFTFAITNTIVATAEFRYYFASIFSPSFSFCFLLTSFSLERSVRVRPSVGRFSHVRPIH